MSASQNMGTKQNCCIHADHASIAGHFPGNPVVPGVVILDEVLEVMRQWQPDFEIAGFVAVKFLSILLPGEEFQICLDNIINNKLKFTCQRGETTLVSGQIRLMPPDSTSTSEKDQLPG